MQSNLAKIGIDVRIEPLPVTQLVHRELHADATWDLATIGWTPDFPDPANVLNPLLRGTSAHNKETENFAHFDDPVYNRRLHAAARLTGPTRYTTYATLDTDLISKAAPMAAVGVWLDRALFSAPHRLPDLPTDLRHRPRRSLHPTQLSARTRTATPHAPSPTPAPGRSGRLAAARDRTPDGGARSDASMRPDAAAIMPRTSGALLLRRSSERCRVRASDARSGRGRGCAVDERLASASPWRSESAISEVMPLARMRERR